MIIHTKKELMSDIKNLGINPADTVLIHSSMKAIGEVEGRGDTVIDALMAYLSDGLLVFPTHTWEQMNATYNYYDFENEPSCVGVLTNLFRKKKGVWRSLHPTHSVAAYGREAESFIDGEECHHTPCPGNGCWGKLVDLDAKILFIGCSLRSNTMIHGVEEWCEIPRRLTKNPYVYLIKTRNGLVLEKSYYRHDSPFGDVSKNYGKLEKPLMKNDIARKGSFGDAEVTVCQARRMVDLTKALLSKNPDLFADSRAIPVEWY